MNYHKGSFSDIESRCTVLFTAENNDIVFERFKCLHSELTWLQDEFESEHLNYCVLTLESAMAAYVNFSDVDYE